MNALTERWNSNVGDIFTWDGDVEGQTANIILDDGGDATMFALWGAIAAAAWSWVE
jgi:adenosylhomocysteinase